VVMVAILWYIPWFELLKSIRDYILVIGFYIWHPKEALATVFLSLDVPIFNLHFVLSPLFCNNEVLISTLPFHPQKKKKK